MTMIVRTDFDANTGAHDKAWRSWTEWIRAELRHGLSACRTWKAEQAAMAQLRSMSDRELADIGVDRSAVGGAVRGDAYRYWPYQRYY
jgi:uncharacterized protein YjiS (DUF1127 family)